MLHFFRTLMKSFIFRIVLFSLLIASFALWGLTDNLTGGNLGRGELAKVGDITIKLSEYQRSYETRVRELRARGVRERDLRFYAQPQIILSQLVEQALLRAESEELGIKSSEKQLQEDILGTEAFKGFDGSFSASIMQQVLRNNNYSVEQYYDLRRQDLDVSALLGMAFYGHHAPDIMRDENYRFIKENRDFDYISLNIAAQKITETATNDTLISFYEENKESFHVPERRDLKYIHLKFSDIVNNVKPSDDEILQYYQENIANYVLQEKRKFQFVFFIDSVEADKFVQNITTQDQFTAKAAQAGVELITNDFTEKAEILDEELANTIFNLSVSNRITVPIEGALGYYVAYLEAIRPSRTQPLSAVRTEIVERLAQEKAIAIYFDALEKAENLSIGGVNLTDIAEDIAVNIVNVSNIDRNGRTDSGRFADNLLTYPNFLAESFDLEKGRTSYVITIDQEAFYLVEAEKIYESTVPDFETIKNKVKIMWEEQEKRNIARNKLLKIQQKILTGTQTLSQIATSENYALLQRKNVNRFGQVWAGGITQKLFELANGGTHLGEDEGQVLLFQLKKITTLRDIDKTSQEYLSFVNNFNAQYEKASLGIYNYNLQQKHKVTLNEALFQRLLDDATQ